MDRLDNDTLIDGLVLVSRMLLFGLPLTMGVLLAAQRVPDCNGGAVHGYQVHSVLAIVIACSLGFLLSAAWGVVRRMVHEKPRQPTCPPEPVRYSPVLAVFESFDMLVGVALSGANPIMVAQMFDTVLTRGVPAYVLIVTVFAVAGGVAGTWGDELTAVLNRRDGEALPLTMLVPQLTTIVEGVRRMRQCKRDGVFPVDPRECYDRLGVCRARIMVAFVSYAVSSWAVLTNLQFELSCTPSPGYVWSSDGALDLVDLVVLMLSAAACLSCDARINEATATYVAVALGVIGAVYALGMLWLQTTSVV